MKCQNKKKGNLSAPLCNNTKTICRSECPSVTHKYIYNQYVVYAQYNCHLKNQSPSQCSLETYYLNYHKYVHVLGCNGGDGAWWKTFQCSFVHITAGLWFSPDTPVSSTNKTDFHDITEILLKVAWSTITAKPYPLCADFMEPCVHKSSSSFFMLMGTFYSFLKNPSCNPADV